MSDYEFSGKTVLVTGGSMGLGETFARELSKRGARVVLVARSEERLARLARELPRADYVATDLGAPGAPRALFDTLAERRIAVDVLVNNAGFATFGRFTEVSLAEQQGEIALNVSALVELTHLFLPQIESRQGGVILVASTAAFQPVPYMAVYSATKAFVLWFGEALWAEYRDRGVRILSLCPGATDTPFFARAGESAAFGKKARPEDVVALGLRSFSKRRASVIHGFANFFTAFLSRLFSRKFTVQVSERLMRPSAP